MKKTRFDGLERVMRGQADTPALHAREPNSGIEPDEIEDDESGDAVDSNEEENPMPHDENETQAAALGEDSIVAAAQADTNNPALSGDAVIRAEERRRIAAVFASEDVRGREMAAAELLANSDMGSDAIVAILPKLTPAASDDDGAAMLAAARENGAIDLGQGGDEPEPEANHGWDDIHAEMREARGIA